MDRATLYLVLAVVGAVVPYVGFLSYFLEAGVGPSFLAAVVANGAAAGFAADVVISSLVFWIWMATDARARGGVAIWPYVVVNLSIGLSCALPAWLWRRELALRELSSA